MADDGLDVNSLAPGSGYRAAGNSYGYMSMRVNYGHTDTQADPRADARTDAKIDPANIPSTHDAPPTVAQKAQLLLQQSQVASAFGALEKADARMDRNPMNMKAQDLAGNKLVAFDQAAFNGLNINDPDAGLVIGTLNAAAQNEAAPIARFPRFSPFS